MKSGVVHVKLSDHSLVYVILKKTVSKKRSRKLCLRSLKRFNRDSFLDDLHLILYSVMDVFDEVDDKLFVFESLYNEVLDEHAPLKHFHVRGGHVPYMTAEWHKAIRHRNRLWKKITKNKTDENYAVFKSQRNRCTSIRRKSIKQFFVKATQSVNPRDFWNAYRPFLNSRNSTQANDIILKENEIAITEKKTNS